MFDSMTLTPTLDRLEFRNLSAYEFLDVALPLLALHREELATDKEKMILNPDHESYLRMDDMGLLMVIGAYRGEELVGYSVSIVTKNLHYSDLKVCQNDVLFLVEPERKGSAGLRLIRETERQALDWGAEIMLWHAKPGTNLDKLMPRLGASVQDIIWKVNL